MRTSSIDSKREKRAPFVSAPRRARRAAAAKAAAAPDPSIARRRALGNRLSRAAILVQRQCRECREEAEEEHTVQRKCRGCEEEEEESGTSGGVQPKLVVGPADDPLEREADRVAARVMRMPRSAGAEEIGSLDPAGVAMRRKERPGGSPVRGQRPTLGAHQLGSGEPLPGAARGFFEGRFGRDFGDVRIHRDAAAGALAASLGARAFTVGRDIAFAPSEFAPATSSGRHLLAHELTHVVQQADGAAAGRAAAPVIQRFTAAECTASTCTPASRCDTVQADFERAEQYVEAARDALDASPLATLTERALHWYFHRSADTPARDIRRRLNLIDIVLLRNDLNANFRCRVGGTCSGSTLAYVNTSTPIDTPHYGTIKLCDNYFGKGSKSRAEILIHEAAHLVGISVSTDDVYTHSIRFRTLPSSQALVNADSYALFASAIGTGSIGVSLLLSVGLSGGALGGGPAGFGWAASFFIDATLQHPVLHIFNPGLRLSATLAGVPESGTRRPLDTALFLGVLPGFRLADPRPSGGTPSFSLYGGPSFNFRGTESAVGAQVAAAVGYQWRFLDISAGLTYIHDPTAVPGARNLVQVGGSVSILLPALNP